MKYTPTSTPIPQDRRAEVNEKVLHIIDSGQLPEGFTKEDIFNAYTGIGGLHGLNREDYDNYHEFSEDKKEFEQGQFLTHALTVEQIVKDLKVTAQDTVCDLACGTGAFFNMFNDNQCYGCDIDHKAIRVAQFLYPEAHTQCVSMLHYEPGIKFDFVVGNPPFNLRLVTKPEVISYRRAWTGQNEAYVSSTEVTQVSQHYFCLKGAELLKPGGILICIVPDSYLKDEFFYKNMIAELDEKFSFLFQYSLSAAAFKEMGVDNFNTKVICFQKRSEIIEAIPYSSTYILPDQAVAILIKASEQRHVLKHKLHLEFINSFKTETSEAKHHVERIKKYLYEIKHQPKLKVHLAKALEKVHLLQTQKWPEGLKWEEWEKQRLTEKKVANALHKIVKSQNRKEEDTYRFVKNNYGFHFKAYSPKAAKRMKQLEKTLRWPMYSVVSQKVTHLTYADKGMRKLIAKKIREYEFQMTAFKELERYEQMDEFINEFSFLNNKREVCKFNEFQRIDVGLVSQKQYSILNWQMGGGKTAASAAWMKMADYLFENAETWPTFIIGPALAINLTWDKFLALHGKTFIKIDSYKALKKLEHAIDHHVSGQYVLVSLDMLVKFKKRLKKIVKKQSQKVNLVFDESDEITNPESQRTRAVLDVFRRVKRKLLATGTTTRNNISEIYSQLELLYNNSVNMLSRCNHYWIEDKDGELLELNNPYWNEPFPARSGALHFKRCFNPSKTTVFGIQKQNQDLFNEEYLRQILEYTIITKKFKDIAGDKYSISHCTFPQNESEIAVYTAIVEDLNSILYDFFNNTGNARKEAALRLLRQLTLLIKATSMPQLFPQYTSPDVPTKALEVFRIISEHPEKIAVGCTTVEATEWYVEQIKERFPSRTVFAVMGDVSFKNREKIRQYFEATEDGILVCTQQSLKSSVNIPTCSKVIIESKQWNIPKIEQFFFRFIRFDSPNNTEVIFVSYEDTIEVNLMALLMAKERLNDYIKTLEYKDNSDIYAEYEIDLDILNSLITKTVDEDGKIQVSWGQSKLLRA